MPLAKHLRLFLALTLSVWCVDAVAQNQQQIEIEVYKDSLSIKTGLEKAKAYGEIGYRYRYINRDSAWHYTLMANEMAEEYKDVNLQSRTLMNIGILHLEEEF